MYAEAVEANGPEVGDDALDVEAVMTEKLAEIYKDMPGMPPGGMPGM